MSSDKHDILEICSILCASIILGESVYILHYKNWLKNKFFKAAKANKRNEKKFYIQTIKGSKEEFQIHIKKIIKVK